MHNNIQPRPFQFSMGGQQPHQQIHPLFNGGVLPHHAHPHPQHPHPQHHHHQHHEPHHQMGNINVGARPAPQPPRLIKQNAQGNKSRSRKSKKCKKERVNGHIVSRDRKSGRFCKKSKSGSRRK
jgi:hypothetical protein